MTMNFPLIIQDHGDSALRSIDADIQLTLMRLQSLYTQRTQLLAHIQIHRILNPETNTDTT
jgi:hypothetical protein